MPSRPAKIRTDAAARGRKTHGNLQVVGLRATHYCVMSAGMAIAQSRLNRSGPDLGTGWRFAKKLGVGPGSVLEWDEQNDQVVVRGAGRYTSEDISTACSSGRRCETSTVNVKDAISREAHP